MSARAALLRHVHAVAPIRICDNGGWTDTWFAGHGKVFNIAVYPYVEVQMRVFRREGAPERFTIYAENYGERYQLADPRGAYDKHPLLEAALDYMHIPAEVSLELTIYSEAPGGCSTGTSAAVSVALIGALDCLTPGRMTPHEVAAAAHRIETELLKQECGIQDQLASAYGGVCFIDMYQFPHAAVSRIEIPDALRWELESRLLLIYTGQAHSSSDVHRKVIRELEDAGPECAKLKPLRQAAEASRDALYAGDLAALGAAMVANTEAQGQLNASLIGPAHQEIIAIARSHGAVGWKVNGAGGNGGSVAILASPDYSAKRATVRAIESANPAYRSIPIQLADHGLRVWESRVG
jgi:D-glycero-alpha-D-manno-heptose-7-phosphate kinase